MELIDGKKIAVQVKQELADEVGRIKAQGGRAPHLVAVLVGNDPASETYVASKVKACQEVGFKSTELRYGAEMTEEQLLEYLPKMKELIQLSSFSYDGSKTLFELRSVCLICDLAHLISADYRSKTTEEHTNHTVYSLIPTAEYMNENYGNHITLTDLAKRAMLSSSSYMRHFKKLFGLPPIEYLIQLRVKHASEMLAETDKSITAIAQDCGFFDCSHMTRIFKQVYDLTPSEYRKKHKN